MPGQGQDMSSASEEPGDPARNVALPSLSYTACRPKSLSSGNGREPLFYVPQEMVPANA